MISSLLGIIGRSPWGMQALLYVSIGLLVTCIGLGVTVEIQSSRLEAAAARQEALGDKLAAQNRAVGVWKSEADLQKNRAKAAAVQAEKVRVITVEKVREVATAQIPFECNEAVKWGALQAQEFNKRWEEVKAQ